MPMHAHLSIDKIYLYYGLSIFYDLLFRDPNKEQQSQRDNRKGMNNTLKYKSYT